VIDVAVLDPSNPGSLALRFEEIEKPSLRDASHGPDGRLSMLFRIALATSASFKTPDAARPTQDVHDH
jgi:hypothetical protein